MSVGAPELLILLLMVVPYGVIVWGIADSASRPEWAWQRSGQNKTIWVVLQVVGLFFCLFGFILTLVYLIAIRPQVAHHQGPRGTLPPTAPGWRALAGRPSKRETWPSVTSRPQRRTSALLHPMGGQTPT